MYTNEDILNYLIKNKDEKYMNFSSSLIPGEYNMMGVRLPILRKLAKEIVKQNNVINYLENAKDDYFEEIMLQGFVIGYSKLDIDSTIYYIKRFVPKINNWSVCDSFCNSLKIAKKQQEKMWNFILEYKDSKNEFELRFLIVMLLSHFINDCYIDKILGIIDSLYMQDYYTQMGAAWLISVCYIKYPAKTFDYLKSSSLNTFCINKAIQKINESYRVSLEDKEKLKILKI